MSLAQSLVLNSSCYFSPFDHNTHNSYLMTIYLNFCDHLINFNVCFLRVQSRVKIKPFHSCHAEEKPKQRFLPCSQNLCKVKKQGTAQVLHGRLKYSGCNQKDIVIFFSLLKWPREEMGSLKYPVCVPRFFQEIQNPLCPMPPRGRDSQIIFPPVLLIIREELKLLQEKFSMDLHSSI